MRTLRLLLILTSLTCLIACAGPTISAHVEPEKLYQLARLILLQSTRADAERVMNSGFTERKIEGTESERLLFYRQEGVAVLAEKGLFLGYGTYNTVQDLPVSKLEAVRNLIETPPSLAQMLTVLGPPWGYTLKGYTYFIQAPADLRGLGFDRLVIRWRPRGPDKPLLYVGMFPLMPVEQQKQDSLSAISQSRSRPAKENQENKENTDESNKWCNLLAEKKLPRSEQDQVRLDRVLARLVAVTPPEIGSAQAGVLDSADRNAITCLESKSSHWLIGVTKGLMEIFSSDDDLSLVLAHELGHAIESPPQIAGKDIQNIPAQIRKSTILIVFGVRRGFEHYADSVGIDLALAAGYDPKPIKMMEVLKAPAESISLTHPDSWRRVQFLEWYCQYRAAGKQKD